MFNCKQAAEAISLSLDAKLTWRKRLYLRLHLWLCPMCQRFRSQVELLHRAFGRWAQSHQEVQSIPDAGLSEAARERIKQTLRNSPRPE